MDGFCTSSHSHSHPHYPPTPGNLYASGLLMVDESAICFKNFHLYSALKELSVCCCSGFISVAGINTTSNSREKGVYFSSQSSLLGSQGRTPSRSQCIHRQEQRCTLQHACCLTGCFSPAFFPLTQSHPVYAMVPPHPCGLLTQ